jgi:hypothetical protein
VNKWVVKNQQRRNHLQRKQVRKKTRKQQKNQRKSNKRLELVSQTINRILVIADGLTGYLSFIWISCHLLLILNFIQEHAINWHNAKM